MRHLGSFWTWRVALASAFFASVAVGVGCANLSPIEVACGNSVIDPREDCDTFPDKASGATCAAPGTANECHYLETADKKCPAGFGAGSDGVCHKASGKFDAPTTVTVPGSMDPQLGDFDGDGNTDFLFDDTDHVTIAYFEGERFRGGLAVPKTRGRRAVVSNFVTSSGTENATDMMLPVGLQEHNEPLVTLAGSSGPTLTPIPYSTEDPGTSFRVVPIPAHYQFPLNGDLDLPGILLDCDMAPVQSLCPLGMNGGLVLEVPDASAKPFPFTNVGGIIWPAPKPALANLVFGARATTGDVDVATGAEVDDLILAFSGETIVRQIAVDPKHPAPKTLALPTVDLGGCVGIHKLENAFISPKNGLARVFVSATCADPNTSVVFEFDADGMGGFGAAITDGVVKSPYMPNTPCAAGPPTLLGIGDMNGDGVDDYVFSYGVVVTPSPAPMDPLASALASNDFAVKSCEWAEATIADINHDGLADVVALSAGDSGLDVVLGGPFSLLATGRLNASGPIANFAVGDFDGDGIPDVTVALAPTAVQTTAATQAGKQESCADGDIAMFWSRPDRIPEDAATIGSLPAIQQLVAARIVSDATTGAMGNGLSDVGVISDGCPGVHSGAVFNGSTDRVLVAPIHLLVGQTFPSFQAAGDVAAAAVGDYTAPGQPGMGAPAGPDGIPDVGALLAVGAELHAYMLPLNADGSVASSAQAYDLKIATDQDFGLKPKKVDEPSIPALSIVPTGSTGAVAVVAYKATSPAGTIHVLAIPSGAAKASDVGTIALTDTSIQPRLSMVTGDFDGDGNVDVAIEVADTNGAWRNGALLITYGKSDGTFEAPCEVTSGDATPVVGIATVDTKSAHPMVAVSSMRSVFLYGHAGRQCGASATKPDLTLAVTNTSTTDKLNPDKDDVLGVLSADMTDDGLADLVVVRRSQLEFRTQTSTFVGGE